MVSGTRITFIGEGMLELTSLTSGQWALGHGGDTLNSAIHMARMGCDVAFFTAIGSDPFSERLRESWCAEGLDCSLVQIDPHRGVGLYAISVDETGERSFSYWRGDSAARHMFALPGADDMVDLAARTDVLAFSLISLAVLPLEGRATVLAMASEIRSAGGLVVFDGNYRPRLWSSREEAVAARDAAIAVASIGLPTIEDEADLAGLRTADEVADYWQRLGCEETIVKLGAAGCRLPDGTIIPPANQLAAIDSSGAGDAFNAGYLAERLRGQGTAAAASKGHHLAGWTIMRMGGIPPRGEDAPYA